MKSSYSHTHLLIILVHIGAFAGHEDGQVPQFASTSVKTQKPLESSQLLPSGHEQNPSVHS